MFAHRPIALRALLVSPPILALALAFVGSGRRAEAQATKTGPTTTTRKKADDKKTEKAAVKEAAKAAEPVDLNSASAEDLMTLPGIGEVTARKIVDGRPHKGLEDLAALGVPARRIEEMKPLAVVRPLPTAVDLNLDPIGRIETLPGVGAMLAKEVVTARPLASYDDLAKVKGLGAAKVDALKGRVMFGKSEVTPKGKTEVKAEATPKVKVEATKPKAEPKVSKEANQPGAKINLNTAGLEELDALFGIGQIRAQAIVEGRPYGKIEDIMKIKGIKEVEFNKIKDQITVGK